MAKGHKTGGRKAGTPNKRATAFSRAVQETMAAREAGRKPESGFDSLEQMRTVAKWFLGQAATAQHRKTEDGKPAPDINWAATCLNNALRALKEVGNYEHPKLAQTTMRSDPEQPLVTRLEVE